MMKIEVFGKQGCALCQTTKRKLAHFIEKWGRSDKVEMAFVDMETVEGLAEGAFRDVSDVPTTIISDNGSTPRALGSRGPAVGGCQKGPGSRPVSVEIKGLIEASLIDWPGKLATVVFVPGCNLRCRYCHARDLVTGASAIDPISFERVLDYLEESRGWIDGVVISGGEPTLYSGLADLARSIRSSGFAVKLDTNGTRPAVIERLLKRRPHRLHRHGYQGAARLPLLRGHAVRLRPRHRAPLH